MRIRNLLFLVLLLGCIAVAMPADAAGETISVTSPNGNQTWNAGTSHTITWTQNGLAGTDVRILLMKGYGFNVAETIANPVPATSGSYTWTVPPDIPAGDDYWIKIVSLTYPAVQGDMWTGWITITPGSISVTAPIDNQTWNAGTSHMITWTQNGLAGTDVRILLMKNYGFNVAETIANPVPASSGSYTWTVPSTVPYGDNYWIKIVSLSYPDIQGDMRTGWITIPGTIRVTSPNGDQTWDVDSSHTITWTQTGLAGTNVRILLMKGYGFNVADTIVDSVPGTTGSFTWTVPPDIPAGNDYWIKIVSLPDMDVQGDMYSGWITVPAHVTVTSIRPARHRHGGKAFLATVTGYGFDDSAPGTAVMLWKPSSGKIIPALSVNVLSQSYLTATFKIPKNVKPGRYSVVVTNPDSLQGMKVSGFRILT